MGLIILLLVLIGLGYFFYYLFNYDKPLPQKELANTFKGRTVVYIALAFVIPLWIITTPLFLYFAYRSYRVGVVYNGYTHLKKLAKLKQLHKDKLISAEEFTAAKEEILKK